MVNMRGSPLEGLLIGGEVNCVEISPQCRGFKTLDFADHGQERGQN